MCGRGGEGLRSVVEAEGQEEGGGVGVGQVKREPRKKRRKGREDMGKK